MNILPLLFCFLIIFSCLSVPFLQTTKTLVMGEKSIASFSLAERSLLNAVEKRRFDKKTRIKDDKTPKPKTGYRFFSLRQLTPRPKQGKFNLALLLKENSPKDSPFYKVTVNLLLELYGHLEGFTKETCQSLVLGMIDASHTSKVKSLETLLPSDPVLQKWYYRFLQGTNTYVLKGKGVASLGDFLFYEEENPKIHFAFASKPLLTALFNKQIASAILTAETTIENDKKMYTSLSKKTLESLLSKTPQTSIAFVELEPHLNFSKGLPRKEEIARVDPVTRLTLKRKL